MLIKTTGLLKNNVINFILLKYIFSFYIYIYIKAVCLLYIYIKKINIEQNRTYIYIHVRFCSIVILAYLTF